jgi:pseudouridine kinase
VWRTTYGGVGRNIAEVAKRLGTETVLVTALGGDNNSAELRRSILSRGIKLHEIHDASCNAPTYLGILDDNHDAIIGLADMDVNDNLVFDKIYQAYFREEEKRGSNRGDIVVLDANLVDS